MSDPTADCPCGHDDNEHVHYCSVETEVGSCDCNAEYVRAALAAPPAAPSEDAAATAEQHRKDVALVQAAMQRIAERRANSGAVRRVASVYVPAEDASDLLMAMHRDGLCRPIRAGDGLDEREADLKRAVRLALADLATYFTRQPSHVRYGPRELAKMLRGLNPTGIAAALAHTESATDGSGADD